MRICNDCVHLVARLRRRSSCALDRTSRVIRSTSGQTLPDSSVARQLFEVRALELDLVPGYGGKNADSSSLAAIGDQMGPTFGLRAPVVS